MKNRNKNRNRKTEKMWKVMNLSDIQGKFEISNDVLISLVSHVLDEIEGLQPGTSSGFARWGRKSIRVKQEDQGVIVEVRVIADYGVAIHKAAEEAVEKISSKIQEITGLKVSEIRIKVEGVNYE